MSKSVDSSNSNRLKVNSGYGQRREREEKKGRFFLLSVLVTSRTRPKPAEAA